MKPDKVLPICIIIFSLLLGFYLLTYSGMAVTDDEQLFVVLTSNLTKGLGNSTNPLLGNDRIRGVPANTEPLHPLMGVPFYQAAQIMGWGRAQILHLPAGIYTALTAALLAYIAIRKGYSCKSAVFLAVSFGLGTIALPYARTNFREPLAALWLTCAMVCVDSLHSEDLPLGKITINLACMLVFVGLAALTKLVCGLCLPFFLISAWLHLRRHPNIPQKKLRRSLAAIAAAILGVGILFLAYQSGTVNNRFSLAFLADMFTTLTRLPHDQFWPALAGMLISPGKGLLVYSPILILAFTGLFPNRLPRQAQGAIEYPVKEISTAASSLRSEQIIAFGSLTTLMIMQALLYNDEWWNITWGMRALLPALPLLMLAALPEMDTGINHSEREMQMFTWGLSMLSFIIQIGRILTTDPAYLGWLAHVTGEKVNVIQWWDLRLMPLWRHWQLALQGIPGGTVWLHLHGANQTHAVLIVAACLLVILIGGYLLIRRKEPGLIHAGMLLLLTLGLTPVLLITVRMDSRYYGEEKEYQQACAWLKENVHADELVLVNAYLRPFWLYNLNFDCTQGDWLGLTYEHGKAYDLDAYFPRMRDQFQLIEEQLALGNNVYLVEAVPVELLSYQGEFDQYNKQFMQVIQFIDSDSNGLIIYALQ